MRLSIDPCTKYHFIGRLGVAGLLTWGSSPQQPPGHTLEKVGAVTLGFIFFKDEIITKIKRGEKHIALFKKK